MLQPKIYKYGRNSRDIQSEGDTKRRQNSYVDPVVLDIAETTGLTISDQNLYDSGKSAFHQVNRKSGDLGKFLAMIERGRVAAGSYLVVENVDRLTRAKHTEAQALVDTIMKAGITIVTANDGERYSYDTLNDADQGLKTAIVLILNLRRAHSESALKSKRILSAGANAVKSWVDGDHTGYAGQSSQNDPSHVQRVDTKERFTLTREADYLTFLAKSVLKGVSLRQSLADLHEAFPDCVFNRDVSSCSKSLKNPMMIGDKVIKQGGEKVTLTDFFPALITREEHARLLKTMNKKARSRDRSTIVNLFDATTCDITCGCCNGHLLTQNSVSTARKLNTWRPSHRVLRCHTFMNKRVGCDNSSAISLIHLEKLIIEFCQKDFIFSDADSANQLDAIDTQILDKQIALDELTAQIDQFNENLMMLKITDALIAKQESLDNQQKALVNDINELKGKKADFSESDLSKLNDRFNALKGWDNPDNTKARQKARQCIIDSVEKITVLPVAYTGNRNHVQANVRFITGHRYRFVYMKRTGHVLEVKRVSKDPQS